MQGPSPRIAHEAVGHVLVVQVTGEIDLVTAPELRAGLEKVAAKARPPDVVVADLTRVEFMGSSGLAVLMDIDGRCRARQVPLRIVATGPAVVRPLEVTGLSRVLNVVGSLDSVIRTA